MKDSSKQFVINYTGNKYKESFKTFENAKINFDKYEVFIEPFCGTFGFSRFIYMYLNKPTNKKFILYDNDSELINFYKLLQTKTDVEVKNIYKKYNDAVDLFSNDEYATNGKSIVKNICDDNRDDPIIQFMINKNISSFSGFYRKNHKKHEQVWFDMFKYCTFIHTDSTEIRDYDTDKTLFYIDPPYIGTCNTFYNKVDDDYIDFVVNMLDKYECLFVHKKNALMRICFKKYLNSSIFKTYNINKKETTHDIYSTMK
jgi:site-specific DNA-adenine methylase